MELYRITAEKYAKKLTASGSSNKWNKKGALVLYAGSSRSLSTLELVVHRNAIAPEKKLNMIIISIPDSDIFIKTITPKDLPKNWRKFQEYPVLQNIGSQWYNNKESLILKVPSAIIPYEYNFIINTKHESFDENIKLIRTENYFWDDRLL